jgi:hypothetical protein
MAERLHLVFVDEGEYGASMHSPQVPGLVFGRPDARALLYELNDTLAFADAPDLPREIHEERRGVSPEGNEYLIRFAAPPEPHHAVRLGCAARLERALTVDGQRQDMLAGPTLVTGEVLYICVLASDTVGWIADQLEPGETGIAAVTVADQYIWTAPLSNGGQLPGAEPLSSLGLTDASTVSDWMSVVSASHSARRGVALRTG